LKRLSPIRLASACAALGTTDDLIKLLVDDSGHELSVSAAYDIAWQLGDRQWTTREREDAGAVLAECCVAPQPNRNPSPGNGLVQSTIPEALPSYEELFAFDRGTGGAVSCR
jgi:hypothetical protein